MVFTQAEIQKIVDVMSKNDEIVSSVIVAKIKQVTEKSIHGRYSLRTTDWLVENGKKSKKRGRK